MTTRTRCRRTARPGCRSAAGPGPRRLRHRRRDHADDAERRDSRKPDAAAPARRTPTARRSTPPGRAGAGTSRCARGSAGSPCGCRRTYTPSAPTGVGTDDYRCFLLDPKVPSDQFITGFNVLPGNPDVVHHVILFRVPADLVAEAEQKDADDARPGLDLLRQLRPAQQRRRDRRRALARCLGSRRERAGLRQGLRRGARRGLARDHAGALQPAGRQGARPQRGRAPAGPGHATRSRPCRRSCCPAPVELPCRPEHGDGKLCDRDAALADVKKRFGEGPGSTADLLHFLCGPVTAGPVQSCTRTDPAARDGPRRRRAHAPARQVDQDRGQRRASPTRAPCWTSRCGTSTTRAAGRSSRSRLEPGDTVKVTCRHSQELRDQLPSFEGQPDKYVVWGEGTTDEMCLGHPAGHPSLTSRSSNGKAVPPASPVALDGPAPPTRRAAPDRGIHD